MIPGPQMIPGPSGRLGPTVQSNVKRKEHDFVKSTALLVKLVLEIHLRKRIVTQCYAHSIVNVFLYLYLMSIQIV